MWTDVILNFGFLYDTAFDGLIGWSFHIISQLNQVKNFISLPNLITVFFVLCERNDWKLFSNWVNKVYHLCFACMLLQRGNIFAAKSFNFLWAFTKLMLIDFVSLTFAYESSMQVENLYICSMQQRLTGFYLENETYMCCYLVRTGNRNSSLREYT